MVMFLEHAVLPIFSIRMQVSLRWGRCCSVSVPHRGSGRCVVSFCQSMPFAVEFIAAGFGTSQCSPEGFSCVLFAFAPVCDVCGCELWWRYCCDARMKG